MRVCLKGIKAQRVFVCLCVFLKGAPLCVIIRRVGSMPVTFSKNTALNRTQPALRTHTRYCCIRDWAPPS